jgi:hypothetical protein
MARGRGLNSSFGALPDVLLTTLNLASVIKDTMPSLEDEVVVEVVGQPGATKQQLYFLAMAAASSVVQQYSPLNPLVAFISPSAGMLMIEYDAADNWVRCTLKYQSGTALNYALNPGGLTDSSFYDKLAVLRGPSCDVNGSAFGFTRGAGGLFVALDAAGDAGAPGAGPVAAFLAGLLGGLAGGFGGGGIPTRAQTSSLPFNGQPILTPCPKTLTPVPSAIINRPVLDAPLNAAALLSSVIPSPNPKPPGDNRSRGAVTVPKQSSGPDPPGRCCNQSLAIVPLIFSALSSPSSSIAGQTFPDPVGGALGG